MVATVLDLQRAVGNRVTSDLIGRGAVQRDLSSDLKADLEKDFPSSVDDEYATRLEPWKRYDCLPNGRRDFRCRG